MNRRIALAILALMMTTMSSAYAGDGFEGLGGSYKEPTGGKMNIYFKGKVGHLRFVLENGDTPGDWEVSQVTKGKTFSIKFTEGPFKDQVYNIIRDKDGKVKELQLVGGEKTIWTPK